MALRQWSELWLTLLVELHRVLLNPTQLSLVHQSLVLMKWRVLMQQSHYHRVKLTL
jgi:hypothetical protein